MITFTQADLDNLKAALVSGASEVQIGDRKVKYKSQKEILEAIRIVQQSLEDASPSSVNVIPTGFSKGKV